MFGGKRIGKLAMAAALGAALVLAPAAAWAAPAGGGAPARHGAGPWVGLWEWLHAALGFKEGATIVPDAGGAALPERGRVGGWHPGPAGGAAVESGAVADPGSGRTPAGREGGGRFGKGGPGADPPGGPPPCGPAVCTNGGPDWDPWG